MRRNIIIENCYLKEFKDYLIENDKSNRTVETYLENVIAFITYVTLADESIESITDISSIDIMEYRAHCIKIKNSVSTINLKLSSLTAYFNFLSESKMLSKNPIALVKKIKINNQDSFSQKTFDEKTFRSLRRLYYREMNPLHICIFELLSKTGMRASELCELKVTDLDAQVFDLNSRSGKVGFIGKGNRYREIPLHVDARTAIRNWMKLREERHLDGDYLLISERKDKFAPSGLRAIVRKYHSKIPGCEQYSLHSYRHYFAVNLLRGDPPVDIAIISKLLGHASVVTSLIYTQANYSDLEQAIEKINDN